MINPEESVPDEFENDGHKKDKIFDNSYDEIEIDTSEINFAVDPAYQPKTYEYTIDEKMILEKVDEVLADETKFLKFQTPDEAGNYRKMHKSDINEIYLYVTTKLPNEPRIEIFSIVSSMFDINSEKFYDSLSNSFKTELITELRGRGYLKDRNTLF